MPHSNYSKIYDLLQELSSKEMPVGLVDFSHEIHNNRLESFAIWRAADGGLPAKTYCSPESVQRLIRFAAELNLIRVDDQGRCSISGIGLTAVDRAAYPRHLGAQLARYLRDEVGITEAELKSLIGGIRRPRVPDFDSIYERVTDGRTLGVTKDRFRGVLYLLERCGLLETMIRKVYFPA
jgi:hypothetical protein